MKFYAPGQIAINFAKIYIQRILFTFHKRVYALGHIATHFEKFIINLFSLDFVNGTCMSRKSRHLVR